MDKQPSVLPISGAMWEELRALMSGVLAQRYVAGLLRATAHMQVCRMALCVQASAQGEQLLGDLGLSAAWGDNYLPWTPRCARPNGSVSPCGPWNKWPQIHGFKRLKFRELGVWKQVQWLRSRHQQGCSPPGDSRGDHLCWQPLTCGHNPWQSLPLSSLPSLLSLSSASLRTLVGNSLAV